MLLSNFNGTYIDTIYQLFNVHCMSAYGSVLWDFSSQVVNVFIRHGGNLLEDYY